MVWRSAKRYLTVTVCLSDELMEGGTDMILAIDTHGSTLRCKGKRFVIICEEKKREVAASKVEQILVSGHALLSSAAVKLAVDNDIDIVFLYYGGSPYARIWNGRFGATAAIRRAQLEALTIPLGTRIVTRLVSGKLDNQAAHLNQIAGRRRKNRDKLCEEAGRIARLAEEIVKVRGPLKNVRDRIFGIEGSAGRIYFSALGRSLTKCYRFEHRSRRPATDPFNCMLNYGYGMLYSIVEAQCILAGLDPATGYLHADAHNRPSLVLDIIEPFRIYAEKCLMELFSKRKMDTAMFESNNGGLRLTAVGRKCIIAGLRDHLDKREIVDHRRITKTEKVARECRAIAALLVENRHRPTLNDGRALQRC